MSSWIWREMIMRSSSSIAAPSAFAILSTALLCSLSDTALSQTATHSATQLPSVNIEAPKQVARPHRAAERPQRPARAANTVAARPTSPTTQTSSAAATAQKPTPAPNSVLGKIATLEKAASSCNGGCATSFKSGNAPWVGCSESGGYFSTFSPTCTDTLTYKSYLDCKETKEFLGWDRNRAWWYCTSLAAGRKFQVAELKRPRRPH